MIHFVSTDPCQFSLCICFARSSDEYVSLKAPTTVLIESDGETLNSFGYEAETKYAELAGENKHHDYYYFKHFKMMLFGKKVGISHTT